MSEELLKELPSGWIWSKLGDVVIKIIGGGTPSKNNPQYWNGSIPWLTVKDMRTRRPADAKNHITEEGVEKSSTNIIPEDTVIIATRIGLGKVVRVPYKAAINQDLKALILPPDVQKGYLEYWFVSKANHLESIGSGTTVKGIRLEQVRNLDFPLAPLEQQKRIVAKIEELFSHIDAGIEALKKAQKLLKQYRQSVLKAAVTGEITKEWRENNKALVAGLQKELDTVEALPKPNRWKTRSKEVTVGHAALSVNDPKTKLPEGWLWKPLVEIARMESGHTPSRKHPEWWGGDIDWIGIVDARKNHCGVIVNTIQHTNDEGLANSASRLLPEGTVCISRTASVGYVVIMGKEMATSQDFVNWVPSEVVTSEWIQLIFIADTEGLRRFGKGTVHKTIYFPEWLSINIGLPCIKEQKVITLIVKEKMKSLERLDQLIGVQIIQAEKNKQSVLASAFCGEFK